MTDHALDAAAIGMGATAPAWMLALQEINTVLAFFTGVVAASFALARVLYWLKRRGKA